LACGPGPDREVFVPVNVAVGNRSRPRVVAVAGVHGDEHEGPSALLDVWDDLTDESLEGTLVAVPVANPTAFRANQRTSPLDGLDLNRVFPGRPDGMPTEQLAHRLFEQVVIGADFVISMHSWYARTNVVPYVEVPANGASATASLEAACSFGLDYVEPLEWHAGLLGAAASRAGIPSMEPEIGGLGVTTTEGRTLYRTGLRGLLRHLGMLAAAPVDQKCPTLVKRTEVLAPTGGFLRPLIEIGTPVVAGMRLARICDLSGSLLADIVAPTSGVLAGVRLAAAVAADELVALIFTEEPPG
jgi:predicted deacylase